MICKGKVVDIKKGDKGVILVLSQYFLDGVLQATGKENDVDIKIYSPEEIDGIDIIGKIRSDILERCSEIISKIERDEQVEIQINLRNTLCNKIFNEQIDIKNIIGIEQTVEK